MSNPDSSQKFIFDQFPIRGQLVGLNNTYKEILSRHNYPEKIQAMLGEFMAASALLSSTLKFRGSLIIQLNAQGQLRTIMAECNHQSGIRAIARYTDDYTDAQPLFNSPQLAISIIPENGQRYQGIVQFDAETGIAGAIEKYFEQSEQIKTRIWLATSNDQAAGYMIQAMPNSAENSQLSQSTKNSEVEDDWDRIIHLSSTIKDAELLELPNEALLHRLFHQEVVRTFESTELEFRCTCSDERSQGALIQMERTELQDILDDMNHITVDCQFCNQRYQYTADQIDQIFATHKNKAN